MKLFEPFITFTCEPQKNRRDCYQYNANQHFRSCNHCQGLWGCNQYWISCCL